MTRFHEEFAKLTVSDFASLLIFPAVAFLGAAMWVVF